MTTQIERSDRLAFNAAAGAPGAQVDGIVLEETSGRATLLRGGHNGPPTGWADQARKTNNACALDAPAAASESEAGMVPEENSGRRGSDCNSAHETPAADADAPIVLVAPQEAEAAPAGMVPEETSGRSKPPGNEERCTHETPAEGSTPLRRKSAAIYAKRKKLWDDWSALRAKGVGIKDAAAQLGVSRMTLWRLARGFEADGKSAFDDNRHRCGRRPRYMMSQAEIQCVREIYLKLDESEARGRGLGSSKVTAFRLAAKADDPRISDEFRRVVLRRNKKTIPPTFEQVLDAPASVIERVRDSRSTMASYVSTPRGRTWVNENGDEIPMRAGTILEADDGTLNFYAYIPWPFGGDKCSDKFGVKLGRWQLLAVVDARWEFCPAFDVVARNLSSYRGEDSGALLGRTMAEVCVPEIFRLERGSWESKFVREALDLCQVRCINAWHSKQKSAVERFFDRLWTPASLIRGHVGRDRGRFKQVTDLALACQDGREDPRKHFLPLSGDGETAMKALIGAIQFINGEPIQSKAWGQWIPQERFEAQLAQTGRQTLDPSLHIFFSREQRVWTVRGHLVGGNVECPLIRFPVYFQCAELWEFDGCRVKCYFDPYAPEVKGTLVLQDEWRGYKTGHVIARDVPALDMPPQVVLATDGWTERSDREKNLQIRKAIARAVRLESWSWLGKRSSEARDGMGNVARKQGSTGVDTAAATAPAPASANRLSPLVSGDQIFAGTAPQSGSWRRAETRPSAAYSVSEDELNQL